MTTRVFDFLRQIDAELLAAYRGVQSSIISDCMERAYGTIGIRPYHRAGHMAGTAVTVKTRPGDNLALNEALKLARPGDVIVVDGGGDVSQALAGEIMVTQALSLGLAGFVIDGAIRDLGAIKVMDFPCYARDVCHRGPYKNGPGAINVPVCVGGLIVNPGDLVVGDDDGVIALSSELARELLPKIRAAEEWEAQLLAGYRARISQG